MLKQIDEYELFSAPNTGGIYAFHLRLIRNASVGLTGAVDSKLLDEAKERLKILVNWVSEVELSGAYHGHVAETGSYESHGRRVDLSGVLATSHYLVQQIENLKSEDVPSFVRTLDALSTCFPPLYVGITLRQTLQDRYRQHKRDHESGPSTQTFGGRAASIRLAWDDLVFSCASQEALRLSDESIRALENYIQFLCRPRLGRS